MSFHAAAAPLLVSWWKSWMSSIECWAKLRIRLGVLSDESSEIRTSNIGVGCSSIARKRFTMFCLSLYEGMPTVILRTLASSPRYHLSFLIDYWCVCFVKIYIHRLLAKQ